MTVKIQLIYFENNTPVGTDHSGHLIL